MENDVVEDVTGDDSPVVDSEIGTPVESSSSEADMVAEYESNNEITYDVDSQEVFKTNLLTGDANSHKLFNQIESTDFLNSDGSFSDRTIELAKANNMTDEEINKHQDTILKQISEQRNEAFKATGMSPGYMNVVMDWVVNNFTKSELAIFENDCKKDMTNSLKSVEKYYIDITVNGKDR